MLAHRSLATAFDGDRGNPKLRTSGDRQALHVRLRKDRFDIISNMEKISTDIYSFRKLRENGFTYVDKTVMLLPLVDMSIGCTCGQENVKWP